MFAMFAATTLNSRELCPEVLASTLLWRKWRKWGWKTMENLRTV
jgi:hypothetical protein